MRVMIDTNIFISAALFPNGKQYRPGDKDFLESPVKGPRIISVVEFLSL